MLKILGILVLGLIFYLIINALTSDGVKFFYCLSDNKCVTVWKKTNEEVYIIPDKYESNKKPSVSHIRTNNKQFITLYFSNEEELSDKIFVRNEGNLETNEKRYIIENNVKEGWEFLEYSDSYKSLLYEPNATKFKDVKASTDYLTISIQENYAIDKMGNKIK